ncbi:MAG: filamentous hemagglutinin N-terminal domain-containing protein, partial [Dehalococcoidia bacterium]
MNHVFKLVWSASRGAWVVASEEATSVGRRSPGRVHRHARATGGPDGFGARAAALLKLSVLVQALWSAFAFAQAPALSTVAPTALPRGGVVTQGHAVIVGGGSTAAPVLDVNQASQRAVIDWQTFNVGAASTVNFNQPNAQAATLNRVHDVNPSQILGKVTAPGQVTLINPSGVYFSAGAVLDVGSLTATTMQQSDADFMAGGSTFTRSGSTGAVVNQGTLRAALGGYVALLAPEVRNEGLIVARQGTVALASGEAVRLNFDVPGKLTSLTVTPSAIRAVVENRSAVIAQDGLIILSATAMDRLTGSVVNTGSLDASSIREVGGRIVLEGDDITLAEGTRIDASGAKGGGTVLVGGDWQGAGEGGGNAMTQAAKVAMVEGAVIDASATQAGDGGKVVLWSDVKRADGVTTAHGRVVARGAGQGARGGQVETSGHRVDIDGARVDAGSAQGTGGAWLIDPFDYTIGAAAATTIAGSLTAGTSVTVDTTADVAGHGSNGNAASAGDITVANSIVTGAMANDATLTLRAHNSIVMNSNVAIDATQNGNTRKLGVVLNSDRDGSGAGAIQMGSGSAIRSHGGNVTLGGGAAGDGSGMARGTASPRSNGVILEAGASIDASGGDIAIRGHGAPAAASNAVGVLLDASSVVTSGAGRVVLEGAAGGQDVVSTSTHGVYIANGSQVRSVDGDLSITGTGGGNGAASVDGNAIGIQLLSGTVAAAGTGNVRLQGTGGNTSGTGSHGVLVYLSSQISTAGGSLEITGSGGGVGDSASNRGVEVGSNSVITTPGALTVTGTGGGSGTGGSNHGVSVHSGSTIRSTGTEQMTVT